MNNEFLKNEAVKLAEMCRAAVENGTRIAVSGHDMPDSDSIISAVMLRELLSRLGVTAEVKFGTRPDGVTERLMRELGIFDGISFDGFSPDERLVLVDHHVTFYTNRVLACIDHHTTPPEPSFALNLVQKASSCGKIIFDIKRQDVHCGGSGCGCSASVFCSHILNSVKKGELKRVLFMATGALMSTVSVQQGESIPSIAHLVHISKRG
jgi:hypothetical protein